MDSISTLISTIKVILISAGALSLAMAVKFSIVNQAPMVWSVILSWLKPPYLYIVFYGIIIIIAVSSRSYRVESDPPIRSEHLVSVRTPPAADFVSLTAHMEVRNGFEEPQTAESASIVVYEGGDRVVELRPVLVNGVEVGMETEAEADSEPEDLLPGSDLAYHRLSPQKFLPPEQKSEYPSPVKEKPLVSSRSEEGGSQTVAEQGTLESIWKMITEGHHAPLMEHRKTSRTLGRHVQESHTFMDKTSQLESPAGPTSSTIWKETSPGRDELNRRAEAFIKKINDDMRLQREESLKHRIEKINGGI